MSEAAAWARERSGVDDARRQLMMMMRGRSGRPATAKERERQEGKKMRPRPVVRSMESPPVGSRRGGSSVKKKDTADAAAEEAAAAAGWTAAARERRTGGGWLPPKPRRPDRAWCRLAAAGLWVGKERKYLHPIDGKQSIGGGMMPDGLAAPVAFEFRGGCLNRRP